jgi:hypothetical protein
MRQMKICATLLTVMIVGGCSGGAVNRGGVPLKRAVNCCRTTEATPAQQAVLATAAQLVGVRTIEARGRRISADCAGVTREIFLRHGIDVYAGGDAGRDANGVRLIHSHVQYHGRLHRGPIVRPGDLVFFDDTWDYNGDGIVNDALTHVGIVETVDSDGTVVFISRVTAAVQRYRMNLRMPSIHRTSDGRILNDYLRRKRWNDSGETAYLAGELFAGFGSLVQ